MYHTEIQQETLDIGWFFTNDEAIGYVASGGGKLPVSVASSAEKNETLRKFFELLPINSDIEINPQLSEILLSPITDHYLECFRSMAEKGLFAFDKTALGRFSDPTYHLVAKPTNPLKLEKLPIEIKEIILQTRSDNSIEEYLNVSLIT
jgi:hypothetical protein